MITKQPKICARYFEQSRIQTATILKRLLATSALLEMDLTVLKSGTCLTYSPMPLDNKLTSQTRTQEHYCFVKEEAQGSSKYQHCFYLFTMFLER